MKQWWELDEIPTNKRHRWSHLCDYGYSPKSLLLRLWPWKIPRRSGPVNHWNPGNQLIGSLSHCFTGFHTSWVVQDAMNCMLILGMLSPNFLSSKVETEFDHITHFTATKVPWELSSILSHPTNCGARLQFHPPSSSLPAPWASGFHHFDVVPKPWNSTVKKPITYDLPQGQITHLRHRPTNKAIQGL